MVPDQVVVTRAFQVLMGAAIVEAAKRQIQDRLGATGASEEPYAATALSRPADLRIPTGTVEIVAQVPGDPLAHATAAAIVSVKVDGRSYQTLPLTFRIGRLRPVVVAARPIDAKSPLGPADWRIERRASTELPSGAMTAAPEAGDYETAQAVREGEVLTPIHLRKRIAVKRGELVTLIVEGPNFRITTQGIAVTDGRKGDTLRVQNPTSRREALGVVEASGVVRVPFASAGGDAR
jgi:flagella basal body P-ring formation protein FlgA